jgi:hypothetical protein
VPSITTTPPVFPCAVQEDDLVATTAAFADAQQIQDEGEQLPQIVATITAGQQIQAEHENLQHIGESTDTAPAGPVLSFEGPGQNLIKGPLFKRISMHSEDRRRMYY